MFINNEPNHTSNLKCSLIWHVDDSGCALYLFVNQSKSSNGFCLILTFIFSICRIYYLLYTIRMCIHYIKLLYVLISENWKFLVCKFFYIYIKHLHKSICQRTGGCFVQNDPVNCIMNFRQINIRLHSASTDTHTQMCTQIKLIKICKSFMHQKSKIKSIYSFAVNKIKGKNKLNKINTMAHLK